MATQQELADQLTSLTAQLTKVRTEVLTKISDLEAAIANAGQVSPEVQTALDALKTEVQAIDDINPDAPVPGA